MPGLELGCHQRLEQRLVLRQQINPGDMFEPFRTEIEKEQVSQYEIAATLRRLIDSGEFFDPDHFSLEINRAIFGNPLEARLGNFGRDVSEVMRLYNSDEALALRILTNITAQKEEAEKKDIPGRIAAAWNRLSKLTEFNQEAEQKRILTFIEILKAAEADLASGIDIVSQTGTLNQPLLLQTSLQQVEAYSSRDARIIPFAHTILNPIIRAIGKRPEQLTEQDSQALYREVLEPLYMLDREMRTSGTTEKIAAAIEEKGFADAVRTRIPVPLQARLEALEPTEQTYNRVVLLCSDDEFSQGREVKRRIYNGFAALEELEDGQGILEHLAGNTSGSKGLAKLLSSVSRVHKDPDFKYPFELSGEDAILLNLRIQLTDKSVQRLKLDAATLQQYIERLESDERFERIGKIITTLAGYKHYQNNQQITLLREIAVAELAGKFNQWRYSHDRAEEQLAVLGKERDGWKKNSRVTRFVGELNALNTHIESIKGMLQKVNETYTEQYNQGYNETDLEGLEKKIEENEKKLRGDLAKSERKEFGYRTAQLREQFAYANLLQGIAALSTDNYEAVLKQAEILSKKRSRNLLYETALWVRETLDQPAYRDARKVTVYETDDLETLLTFGETPVPHCQNWKVDSTYNRTLLSFVADANKKLIHIANGNDKPIAMSMTRLVDWEETPTILVENIYSSEWSEDYGIALFGSLADKALAMHEETGKEVRIATNNQRLISAMEKFGKKYKAEVHEAYLETKPAKSKNPCEYWDCGIGIKDSCSRVNLEVSYISFGGEDDRY